LSLRLLQVRKSEDPSKRNPKVGETGKEKWISWEDIRFHSQSGEGKM
jgi:hypothetical protein